MLETVPPCGICIGMTSPQRVWHKPGGRGRSHFNGNLLGRGHAAQHRAKPEFEADFIISAGRRNLPRDYVDLVIARCEGFRQRIHVPRLGWQTLLVS
jgi:hypothetical protein